MVGSTFGVESLLVQQDVHFREHDGYERQEQEKCYTGLAALVIPLGADDG
jgi:hypothetical protein